MVAQDGMQLNPSLKCNDCSGKINPFCFGSTASHQWDHRTAGSFSFVLLAAKDLAEESSTDFSIPMPWSMPPEIGSHRNRDNVTPVARPTVPVLGDSSPVIHHGVICDSCENTVEGIRHKCLDCSGQ